MPWLFGKRHQGRPLTVKSSWDIFSESRIEGVKPITEEKISSILWAFYIIYPHRMMFLHIFINIIGDLGLKKELNFNRLQNLKKIVRPRVKFSPNWHISPNWHLREPAQPPTGTPSDSDVPQLEHPQVKHSPTEKSSNSDVPELDNPRTGTSPNWDILQLGRSPTGTFPNWDILQLGRPTTDTSPNWNIPKWYIPNLNFPKLAVPTGVPR